MCKHSLLALVVLFSCTLSVGCGDGGNQVVEQPDFEKLEAKKQEFAEFQQQMANQSKLPGQR